mmetsp:Transcript_21129/g.29850  ORF Transcript_21129/g.29850 Transcript_21129/m.29850 type:complete len:95 (-) Transcript_21129:406-690(-)
MAQKTKKTLAQQKRSSNNSTKKSRRRMIPSTTASKTIFSLQKDNETSLVVQDDNLTNCNNAHKDCQCYLRRGLFLPKGLLEEDEEDNNIDNERR